MSDLSIPKLQSMDVYTLRKVLSSPEITETEKVNYIKQNNREINSMLKLKLTGEEYSMLVSGRPLVRFKPIKNSFTKRGDKILLAKALGIEPTKVENCIATITNQLKEPDNLKILSRSDLNAVKAYVYRHGTVDQLTTFLDYELSNSKNLTKTLRNTLEYHTGGVADYFIRPIHRMSNRTLVKVYQVIDKNLAVAQQAGTINEEEVINATKWALKQIYQIQYNSKFINSIKTKNI